jgi:tetratricopeptide (TPR) repeat protein
MKRVAAVVIALTVLALAFAVDNINLLLSKEYLIELQSLDSRDQEAEAFLAIAIGLKYRETIQPNYKVWFTNLYSGLEVNFLSPQLQEGLQIVEELVFVSTVSALNMLYSSGSNDDLIKAIALRTFFYDWIDTRDPRSAKQIEETANELIDDRPGQYFPYKALLELYSSGGSMDVQRLLEIRETIFSENIEGLLGDDLIESEFVAGLEELVIDDFLRLGSEDPLSRYYAAMSYIKTGESLAGVEILEDLDLNKISPRFASNASLVIGDMKLEEGDFDGAIERYQESVRFWSNNSRAIRNLGMAYYKIKDRDYYDLARFYLQLSGYEDFDSEVSSALRELRRRAIFELALVTVVPLTVVVVVGLFLLEYVSRKRKSSQERKAMREDGGNNED